MTGELLTGIAVAILCFDCALFAAVLIVVRRGMAQIKTEMAAVVREPEVARELGRGFAAGMRSSAQGTIGHNKQVTQAEERACMAEMVESFMTANLPMIAMAEKQIPEFRQIVKRHPEAAMVLLQRFGPALEAKVAGMVEQAAGNMGKAI